VRSVITTGIIFLFTRRVAFCFTFLIISLEIFVVISVLVILVVTVTVFLIFWWLLLIAHSVNILEVVLASVNPISFRYAIDPD